jgi:2-keto-3-deoxy-6-phosphogluconate aldolase
MRTFIQYDADGQIIAVVQTETPPEGLKQPFYLKDKGHGAAEVTQDSAAAGHTPIELCQGFTFDAAQHKLVKKPDEPKAA